MKSYKLLHQLINLVEEFEQESGEKELSLQEFAGYLVNQVEKPAGPSLMSDVRFGGQEKEAQQGAFQIDNNISRLFIYMSRYAKSYIKKALDGTPLQTPEDFTCLAILLTHDHLSKGDLISRNLQEKTSGTEVIRRLLAAGLVEQWDDDEDKRGKRIGITNAGKELLYHVFIDLNSVGKIVTADLTITEKLTLQYLLQKLENFHYYHHQNKSVSNKSDLKVLADTLA